MNTYRRETRSSARWLVAAIIFIIAMTFTIDQAFGSPTPPRRQSSSGDSDLGGSYQPTSNHEHSSPQLLSDGDCGSPDPVPSAVPEPTTIILVGLGLAAAGALRRKAN